MLQNEDISIGATISNLKAFILFFKIYREVEFELDKITPEEIDLRVKVESYPQRRNIEIIIYYL